MELNGIHHVSCITGDARTNVDFYTRVLGLRLVKKTVNQDNPSVYHLFYADDAGTAGADITFFEYPHAVRGRAGAGMIHTIVMRVATSEALDFWESRLADEAGSVTRRAPDRLAFTDPEGLGLELVASHVHDAPLTATRADVPAEFRLQGFDSVRAYATNPDASRELFESILGFAPATDPESSTTWEVRGPTRGATFHFEPAPEVPGRDGAGSVHHVAWSVPQEEHAAWATYLTEHGVDNTPVIDRHYFKALYFREPNGVLFEIADTGSVGFAIDEDPAHLGERLSLPPKFEPLRERIEPTLQPISSS